MKKNNTLLAPGRCRGHSHERISPQLHSHRGKGAGELGTKTGIFTVDYARVEPTDPHVQKNADGKTTPTKWMPPYGRFSQRKMSAAPWPIMTLSISLIPRATFLSGQTAFLDWIKSGKAFVGDAFRGPIHSWDKPLDPYVKMIGGEFGTMTVRRKSIALIRIQRTRRQKCCRRFACEG